MDNRPRPSTDIHYYHDSHSPSPSPSYPPSPSVSTTDLHHPYRMHPDASSSTLVSPAYGGAYGGGYGSYTNMRDMGGYDTDTNSLAPLNKKRSSFGREPYTPNTPNSSHPLRKAFTVSRASLSIRMPSADRLPTAASANSRARSRSLSTTNNNSNGYGNSNAVPTPESYTSLSLFLPSRDQPTVYAPREHHLDLLKFVASLIVLTGTFFQAFLPLTPAPLAIAPGGALQPFISQSLGVTCLLLLSARSLVAPLYTPYPNAPSYRPSFHLLSRQILLRPIRFAGPVLVTVILQWALADTADAAAVTLNDASWVAPMWKNINNFGGLMNLMWGCFTWGADSANVVQVFGSNLWMSAWLFQASYFALILFVVLAPLPNTKYWVLIVLAPFLWATNSYFLPALLGVALTDLGAHGMTPLLSLPILLRIPLQLAALALAVCLEVIPVLRNAVNNAMATWNVRGTYGNILFTDILFAVLVLIAVDSCPLAKTIMSWRPFRILSRLSAGAVLMAPIIVYAALPSMNPSLAGGWVLTLLLGLLLAIPFRLLVEVPTMIAAEIFVDKMRTWGGDGLDAKEVDAYFGGQRHAEEKEGESSEMKELRIRGEKR